MPTLLTTNGVASEAITDCDEFAPERKTPCSVELLIGDAVKPISKLLFEKSKVDSASNVFAVPEPVITLLFALLFIVVCVIPVQFEPSP